MTACNNSVPTNDLDDLISKSFDSNCILSIEGMSCQKGCASSIERELNKIGVEQIILAIEEIDGGKFDVLETNDNVPGN